MRISADLNLADLGFWERGLCLKERDDLVSVLGKTLTRLNKLWGVF